jgi:hypothetical protein
MDAIGALGETGVAPAFAAEWLLPRLESFGCEIREMDEWSIFLNTAANKARLTILTLYNNSRFIEIDYFSRFRSAVRWTA